LLELFLGILEHVEQVLTQLSDEGGVGHCGYELGSHARQFLQHPIGLGYREVSVVVFGVRLRAVFEVVEGEDLGAVVPQVPVDVRVVVDLF